MNYNAMREELKKEGFDGLIMLGETRPNLDGTLRCDTEKFKKSGVDQLYAYCNIYTHEASYGYYHELAESGLKGAKCIGTGWDNRYWCPIGGFFIINNTPSQFENAMIWMNETAETNEKLDNLLNKRGQIMQLNGEMTRNRAERHL